jgi:hypothetical protein
MNNDAFIVLPIILIGFPITFVAIWSFVCWLIALIGGWQRMAGHYRTNNPPPPGSKKFDHIFGMVGVASYRATLNVAVAPEGLYLSVMRIFGVGHPPLLIPWADVRVTGNSYLLLIEGVVVEVGQPKITTLRLPKGVGEAFPIR